MHVPAPQNCSQLCIFPVRVGSCITAPCFPRKHLSTYALFIQLKMQCFVSINKCLVESPHYLDKHNYLFFFFFLLLLIIINAIKLYHGETPRSYLIWNYTA